MFDPLNQCISSEDACFHWREEWVKRSLSFPKIAAQSYYNYQEMSQPELQRQDSNSADLSSGLVIYNDSEAKRKFY